jgi:hypothetical protein
MATIDLTEKSRSSERGADWTLAFAFFGVVASLYGAVVYAVYVALF